MRFRILLVLALSLLIGCAGQGYKVPKGEYRVRVQTLGVLPLMVDKESTVTHPRRQEVLDLLQRHNAGKEERLVNLLRDRKSYFDVRQIPGDPQQLFDRLVIERSMRGKGDSLHRAYEFDPQFSRLLAGNNVVDALLVVILDGVTRPEKRRDRTLISYLEAEYNSILAYAAVVLPSGAVIWEYPVEEPFLNLQYPDFDEAYYNKTDAVKIKDVSIAGLDRTLAEKGGGVFDRTPFPLAYETLFKKITGALDTGMLKL